MNRSFLLVLVVLLAGCTNAQNTKINSEELKSYWGNKLTQISELEVLLREFNELGIIYEILPNGIRPDNSENPTKPIKGHFKFNKWELGSSLLMISAVVDSEDLVISFDVFVAQEGLLSKGETSQRKNISICV